MFAVPELPRSRQGAGLGFLASYGLLVRRIKAIYRTSPHTIYFLLASAVFRDGLAAVFTFGGIIAAGTFGFELKEVIFFAIFGNVVAAVGRRPGRFPRRPDRAEGRHHRLADRPAGRRHRDPGPRQRQPFLLRHGVGRHHHVLGLRPVPVPLRGARRSPPPGPTWPGSPRTANPASCSASTPPPAGPSASSPPPSSRCASPSPPRWWRPAKRSAGASWASWWCCSPGCWCCSRSRPRTRRKSPSSPRPEACPKSRAGALGWRNERG